MPPPPDFVVLESTPDNIRAEIHSKGSAQAPGWLPSRPLGAGDRRRRETGAVLGRSSARSRTKSSCRGSAHAEADGAIVSWSRPSVRP